jgi:hypothetical protein
MASSAPPLLQRRQSLVEKKRRVVIFHDAEDHAEDAWAHRKRDRVPLYLMEYDDDMAESPKLLRHNQLRLAETTSSHVRISWSGRPRNVLLIKKRNDTVRHMFSRFGVQFIPSANVCYFLFSLVHSHHSWPFLCVLF